jgi:hypothetical protein
VLRLRRRCSEVLTGRNFDIIGGGGVFGLSTALEAGPGDDIAAWSFREASTPEPASPRLLDRVRQALRARHMSRRPEEAYVAWIRRYIFFHHKRHPAEMGAREVTKFLTSLAVDGHGAASTGDRPAPPPSPARVGLAAGHETRGP